MKNKNFDIADKNNPIISHSVKHVKSFTMKRSFPSPPKRTLAVREPPRFQALTPEMMISETDDDVMGDKVAQEVRSEQVTYGLDLWKI